MSRSRSSNLLILLVTVPVALLAWLGTYLLRDAERRTTSTRNAILHERLSGFSHHLTRDLSEVVTLLDQLPESLFDDPAAIQHHPWLDRAITAPAQLPDPVQSEEDLLPLLNEFRAGHHTALETGGGEHKLFRPLPIQLARGWRAHLHQPHLAPQTAATRELQSGLMWQIHPDGDRAAYWRKAPTGRWIISELHIDLILERILQSLPPPGMGNLPGMMLLSAPPTRMLYQWGNLQRLGDVQGDVTYPLSAPLERWNLSYITGPNEFPQPLLFPILLGIVSGCVLVLALATLMFRENNRELRVASQRVSFVNQISHELKTPLTNIQLYTEMARARVQDATDQIADRQLGVVEAETSRLHRLIQNVLNFSRSQRNQLTVTPKPTNIADTAREVVEHWRPLLEKRQFEIEVDLPETLQAIADQDAVQQILGNLVSNVEKYAAEPKWIRIEGRQDGDKALLTVSDRGEGIPQAKSEAIFQPFERLRSDTAEGVSGTGVGLTISRELSEQQDGDLKVDSQYRNGARFILTLPSPPETPTTQA